MLKRTISGVIIVAVMILMIDLTAQTFLALWAILAFATIAEFAGLCINNWPKLPRRGASWTALAGATYIALGYGLLAFGFGTEPHERMFVLTFVTLIWANDVGAYLVGSLIGRHKMAPRISPKKSWEGFAGGLIMAFVGGLVWYWVFWSRLPELPAQYLFVDVWFWAVLGVVAGVGAVLGDLLESAFKRRIGVKDSGKLIPGHGGLLDRFDALLMASPFVFVYVWLAL